MPARALCNIRAGSGLYSEHGEHNTQYVYTMCGVLHEKRSRNWLRVLFAPAVTREGHMSCNCAYRLPFAQIVYIYISTHAAPRENKPQPTILAPVPCLHEFSIRGYKYIQRVYTVFCVSIYCHCCCRRRRRRCFL